MTILVPAVLFAAGLGLLAELFARYWIRRGRYFVYQPGRRDLTEFDLAIVPTCEPRAYSSINSIGERGGELPRGGDTFKVLLCGGSSAGCLLLDQRTSLGGVLESRLSTSDCMKECRVHVGVIGKSSVDSVTLNRILRHILPQYELPPSEGLDAIIVLVGASDVLRWLEMGAPPERVAPALGIDYCFEQNPEVPLSLHPRRWGLARQVSRWLSLRLRHRRNFGHRYKKARLMRANAKETRRTVPPHEVLLESFRKNLREILEQAQSAATVVLVARQPWFRKEDYSADELSVFWNGSVGNAYYGEATIFYAPEVISQLMSSLDAVACEVCQELGVAAVDCGAAVPSSLENYIDQFHFTVQGSALAADALCDGVVGELNRKGVAP